jgi:hypothetical protein
MPSPAAAELLLLLLLLPPLLLLLHSYRYDFDIPILAMDFESKCTHPLASATVTIRCRYMPAHVLVCYCRYDFDIPILAMDLVAAGGAVTLAIIDACPVSSRLSLPQHYVQTMADLQQNFLPGAQKQARGAAALL